MKRLLALASLAIAAPVWSADFGVGVSAKSNDSTIYVPIDINDSFRVEPLVRYSKDTSVFAGGRSKYETYEIGTGLFKLYPLTESIHIYYGGRLSYLNLKAETNFQAPVVDFNRSSSDGYRIAPTLGFEYFFKKHLSIGGEAQWYYSDLEANRQDVSATGTNTNLILRLRF